MPVVIFDVDDTTVNTQERERHAAMAAGRRLGLRANSTNELLAGTLPREAERRRELFNQHFLFDHSLLRYDHPNPGATAFLNALRRAGAKIVHLTSRPPDDGLTAKKLRQYGFPVRDAADLIMQTTHEKTPAWKERKARGLARTPGYVLVAAFDNEPANARALARVLSPRRVIRIRTVANADAPRPPPRGLKVLQDFRTK